MQQAITARPPNDSATPETVATRITPRRNRFVINLCSSTSPVSLTRPDHAGLKRFTFFVSRRREEGRERFRLHMGYFESQEEAERLLDIVREIYPGAWAGLAPGQRLQAKADAEADSAAGAHVQPPNPPAAAASEVAPLTDAPAQPASNAMASEAQTSEAQPEPPAPALSIAAAPEPSLSLSSAPAAAATAEAPAVREAPVHAEPTLAPGPSESERVADPVQARAIAKKRENEDTVRALSNVRAAIASLEDSQSALPTVAPLPELKPAVLSPAAHARVAAANHPELSDSGVLRVLESRDDNATTVNQPRLPPGGPSSAPAAEKMQYAVQLMWSVQPIDIAQIPQLAIFSAYTLYGAEGNRDGRRWYGVRLGFFTDAVSAKQVAHYVRSDFATVSVVPVTVRERERATLAASRPETAPVAAASAASATQAPAAESPAATSAAPATPASGNAFEFIDDKQPAQAPTAGGRTARGAPGKRAKARSPRQLAARSKSKPMTLEETLEILGAGELKIDEGRRASINDGLGKASGADGSKGKTSRFGRLLERLSGIGG